MPIIPPKPDFTIEAMKKACERKALEQPARSYVGASIIGHPCARFIWYGYKQYPKKPFTAKTLWAFDDGHRTEDLISERLRLIDGIELKTHNENGYQYGFSMYDGQFKGHYDGQIKGILQAPKAWHVWECKCCSEKKFKEFQKTKQKYGEKDTLQTWNVIYWVQAQIYMDKTGYDRHYTTVASAGGRDLDSCRTEYKPEVAERYKDRARAIIETKQPPPRISENQDHWQCRFCDYREVCHGKT